jgi:hypothetical protein
MQLADFRFNFLLLEGNAATRLAFGALINFKIMVALKTATRQKMPDCRYCLSLTVIIAEGRISKILQ